MDIRISNKTAEELVARTDIVWHQKFRLSPKVATPGTNDIEWLCDKLGSPSDLSGQSVLDIGTTNGGAAFLAEARGANRVVAVDIYPPDRFGFSAIAEAAKSRVEFIQASIYELPGILKEKFDVVYFYGVLYHLRHPLLALDSLRQLCRGIVGVETAVAIQQGAVSYSEFYPYEYHGDSSNWFVPTIECARDWLISSGFIVDAIFRWPEPHPSRGLLSCHPASSDGFSYQSYEVPLRVVTDASLPPSAHGLP